MDSVAYQLLLTLGKIIKILLQHYHVPYSSPFVKCARVDGGMNIEYIYAGAIAYLPVHPLLTWYTWFNLNPIIDT